jgi:hypothetical protein
LGLGFYRRAYKKAKARRPAADALFAEKLKRLDALEQTKCASIDRSADAFASLLRHCTETLTVETERRITEHLLYHVGRYLYLVDALEDLPKDVASDSYNPLRYRYGLENGHLSEQDKASLLESIEGSISMAASALELLPSLPDRAILENIVSLIKNVAKIIIATIFPFAIDETTLDGNNPLIVSTKGVISLSSLVDSIVEVTPYPNFITFPTTIPTTAANPVVKSNIPKELNVSLPKFSPSSILIITLNIDVNTNGTTNIFNKSINPEPNKLYHLLTSFNQVISEGFAGKPATP